MKRMVAVFLLLAGLTGITVAQRRTPTTMPGDTGRNPDIVVRVRIIGGPVNLDREPVQVDLLQATGFVVMRNFYSGSEVVFGAMPAGAYILRASGPAYETTQTSAFEVLGSEFTHQEMLEVRLKPKAAAQVPATGPLSAHDAAAPEQARKEFEAGKKDLLQNKLASGEGHLAKAIGLYSKYESAYSLLGTAYLSEKKQQQAEETFRKGLEVAPENPRIQAGLGRILLQRNEVDPAEQLLKKSVATDATYEPALALLARAEFQKYECDDAVKHARAAHALPQHKEAFVHLLAGSCLEDKDPAASAKEYELLLKEDPNNANAGVARERLKSLTSAEGKKN